MNWSLHPLHNPYLFLYISALLFCFLCAYWLSVHISQSSLAFFCPSLSLLLSPVFLPTVYLSSYRFSSWPPLRYARFLTYSVWPLNHFSLETLNLQALSTYTSTWKQCWCFCFHLSINIATLHLADAVGWFELKNLLCVWGWMIPPYSQLINQSKFPTSPCCIKTKSFVLFFPWYN